MKRSCELNIFILRECGVATASWGRANERLGGELGCLVTQFTGGMSTFTNWSTETSINLHNLKIQTILSKLSNACDGHIWKSSRKFRKASSVGAKSVPRVHSNSSIRLLVAPRSQKLCRPSLQLAFPVAFTRPAIRCRSVAQGIQSLDRQFRDFFRLAFSLLRAYLEESEKRPVHLP